MTDKNDKPVVSFRILQSVEDYVEKSGKFRTECASFKIPGSDSGAANVFYIPYCEKQRFDFGPVLNDWRANGVFSPPEKGKKWSQADVVLFCERFHDISCPQACRGYSDKRVGAPVEDKQVSVKAPAATVGGKWTRKEILNLVVPLVVTAIVALVCVLLGWLMPEARKLLHLGKAPSEEHAPNVTGSIVNNGGVINNPTINNGTSALAAGPYELSDKRRDSFLKLLTAQTAPRDIIRIGCTNWSEKSCVAAGRFLLLFSQAGWQIEENKVFRLEPQIPIVGVAIATHAASNEPTTPLPPHLGRWHLMDESHKTIYWAFHSIDIPASGTTDNTLKERTIGVYFGSEP
jgi:hypothetical protein